MDKDKIADKLRKLIALQNGAMEVGSISEAENAAARIQELLMKYNMELTDVELEKEEVSREDLEASFIKTEPKDWITKLYNAIAMHNFCKLVYIVEPSTKGPKYYRFALIGADQDREVVKYLTDQLVSKLRYLARESYKKNQRVGEKRNTYIRGFLTGAVNQIFTRLIEQRKKDEQAQANTTALVLKKEAKLEAKVQQEFGALRKHRTRSKGYSGREGFTEGVKAGKTVSINRGVGSSSKTKLLN